MQLDGSCHCGAVRFSLTSHSPYPYMLCYCSICRKTAGGGGYAINIMGDHDTLAVTGREHITVYRVDFGGTLSNAHRHFCSRCGSALWVHDPSWPELVHPFASAIDTPLPLPPQRVHIMKDSAASWAVGPESPRDDHFGAYPELSIEAWHKRHGLWEE